MAFISLAPFGSRLSGGIRQRSLFTTLTALLTLFSGQAQAEDIEIYLGQAIGSYAVQQSAGGTGSTSLPLSGHVKNVSLDTFLDETSLSAINRHTIAYEYYHDSYDWSYLPEFDYFAAEKTGTLAAFTDYPRTQSEQYSFKYTAVLNVPANGTYTFHTHSDDGSKLYIDGTEVVNNDGLHGRVEESASIYLTAGPHNLITTFFENTGGDEFYVEWQGPGLAIQPVEPWLLPLPSYNAIDYEYFEGSWTSVPDFNALTPVSTGKMSTISLGARQRDDYYGFRYTTRINAPVSGSYTFFIGSDDGSELFLNGSQIIDNDGLHGYYEKSATVNLAAGEQDIIVTWFEHGGGDNLTVRWSGPGIPKQDVTTWLVGDGSNYSSEVPSGVHMLNKGYTNGYMYETESNNNAWQSDVKHGSFAAADKWEIYHAGESSSGNDIVRIVNRDSNRLLLEGPGNNVEANEDGWHWSRLWEMHPVADNVYQFSNVSSGRYLEGNNNSNVDTDTYSANNVKKWEILAGSPNAITSNTAAEWDFVPVSKNSAGNSIIRIQNKLSGRYLGADYPAASDNNAYTQNSINSDELWEIISLGPSRYHIRNVNDGRYLHANDISLAMNVQTVQGQTSNWIWCANEWDSGGNGYCNFSGTKTIRYGANGSWATGIHTDGVTCSNGVFGDPLRGTPKACYFLDESNALTDASEWIIITTVPSGDPAPPPNFVQPNVLFVLDASGSMNWTDDGESGTRLERMKTALSLVLDNISNVNVGLMRFSHSNSGGRIVYPVAPIEGARADMNAIINSIVAKHGTPSVGALYEAARYFRGEKVEFGTNRAANTSHTGVQYSRVSHPDSYSAGNVVRTGQCGDDDLNHSDCVNEKIAGQPVYNSPMVAECQSNHIVLLTDGKPTSTAITEVESLISGTCASASSADGKCGEEIAQFLATTDQSTSIDNVNTITTHTIGFNFSNDWLKEVASAGGGKFYTADSALDLVAAVESILLEAKSHENTIVAPAATLDQTSRLAHRDDIYLALFEPSYSPAWSGNLKRYYFDGEIKDASTPPTLAIDPDTGRFYGSAQSYWSPAADGGEVGEGGAASQLNKNTRKVTTYFPGNTAVLTADANAVVKNNITAADLDLPDPTLELTTADRDRIVDWASGIDVNDSDEDGSTSDTRNYLGDPLHSTPALITYDWHSGTQDSIVFFGTNEGYLHAVNTDDGKEVFSFIPEALLPNLKHRFANKVGKPKVYGLDGPITVWVNDADNDQAIGTGDHAYLYIGMRRGGRNYYAIDVTNKTSPEHKWFIEGGTGQFAELAQTWSKPVLTKIINPADSKETNVLIFGGGYDLQQDDVSTRTADTIGRAIFIVNADTGALIWRGGGDISADEIFPAMNYSIPSDPSVIDLNGDGFVDQIYIGDMGGQVWRFDVDNNASFVSNLVTGGVIADLAGTEQADNRRFFNQPDISIIRKNGVQTLVVAIGSGYRAHPLNQVIDDRFYVIQQKNYLDGQLANYGLEDAGSYSAADEDDLYNITANKIGQGNASEKLIAQQALDQAAGWYLELAESGEKTLSSSITVNGQVIFTTYSPSENADVCAPVIGGGNLYILSILDGTPTINLSLENGGVSDPLTHEDRQQDLERDGIPPSPRVLFPEGESPTLLIGPEKGPEIDFGKMAKRVSWVEVTD